MYDLNVLDEKVYLLTKNIKDKPQFIYKLNANGNTDSIYALPDSESYFTGFALDKEREQMYLTSTNGEIVKAALKFD